LMHYQMMHIDRTSSYGLLLFEVIYHCKTGEKCALDHLQKRVQHLIEKLDSKMPQFWASIDVIFGNSLTINSSSSSLECYRMDGGKVQCQPNEKQCLLQKSVAVGDSAYTVPMEAIMPSKAGCEYGSNGDTIYIRFTTMK
jgi:hypothetical protein